jgi:hypothetical protein
VAAQDQALQTKYHTTKILQTETDSKCWLCQQLDKEHCYEEVPKSLETSRVGKVTILWKQWVQTDRTVPNNNKLDIIIRDNETGTCMLMRQKCDKKISR